MRRPQQIFAVSGLLNPPPGYPPRSRSLLIDHAVSLTGVDAARICYVPTAMGDNPALVASFLDAFADTPHTVSHLSLFPQPSVADVRAHLLSQDLVWVSGGSVVNLLAVWRAHRLPEILRECWEAGVVLAGGSAGSICWHVGGSTDSFSDDLDPVTDSLAFLPYSNGVHHDFPEQPRRAKLHEYIESGLLPDGYATDDGTGLHYVGTELVEAVTLLETADAYRVERTADGVVERPLGARLLRP
ncbi:peptidase E [Catellatospora sp. KI3]|uniref:Type 1 glutamine amidotransferase-like domain-containing protein n=1 Tax=Catellatospora sp. KI3 TaxID=3041620 RepID=UPI00248253BB|nr:peptidase E [Catellatospora sp. KI3]MDI1462443.1 peptidase E [Catellatospora sp. KI3]